MQPSPGAASDEDPPGPAPGTPPSCDTSKIRQRLHSFRSPFRIGSPFHIGSVKRAASNKSIPEESEAAVTDTMPDNVSKSRKKVKKTKSEKNVQSGGSGSTVSSVGPLLDDGRKPRKRSEGPAGALVRKLSGIRRSKKDRCEEGTVGGGGGSGGEGGGGGGRATENSQVTPPSLPPPPSTHPQPTPPPPPLPTESPSPLEPDDAIDVDSHSVRTVEMEAPLPPTPSEEDPERPAPPPADGAPEPTVAAVHPVSTLPFTKSAWKRRPTTELARPVEEPSPGTALKRRIAFVAQASTYLSEERGGGEEEDEEEEGEEEVGSLERVVELARSRLAGAAHTARGSADSDRAEDMPAYGELFTAHDKPHDDVMGAASSHTSAPGGERREHLYKILVIGELGTGKTSIIKRYVHQFFSQHYRATIGVDFALKVINWDANTIIRLQLWDIAGQERFGNMTRVYYKEAVGAFIVFDVTRVATFDAVLKWKSDLDSKVQLPDGSPIPCVLLANKCDQQKEGIVNIPAKMEEYCREKGFAGWFETSAKENVNIEEAARSLVNKILLNDKLLQSNDSKDSDRIALDHRIANGENGQNGTSKNCNC